MVVWSESEFWPNILTGVKERNIPSILLNARMSQRSFKKWLLFKGLIKSFISGFDLCLGQNQAEVDRLITLGANNAKISGNLKYASEILPYDEEKLEQLKTSIGDRPHILWSSTHAGEEEVACRVHKELIKVKPDLLTIIVPRHPKRKAEIADIINNAGFKGSYRSENALPQKNDAIYLADTIGEMGLFYKLSHLCIIGGSFVPWGGHNIIEPAQFGDQIFYGPYMMNFVSIAEDFESKKATLRLKDESALVEALTTALNDPEHFSTMAVAAKKITKEKSTIIEEILAELAPFIKRIKHHA